MKPSNEPNQMLSEFEKLLAGLARQGIDFAVAGGLAVILNGYPRLTLDADILVNGAPENLGKLLAALKKWGDGYAGELTIEDFTAGEGAVRVTEFFDLDIFVRLGGKTLDDFRPNLRSFESGEVRIAYLSPADLIFLKEGSWREKDQLDVSAMKEILAREAGQK